MTPAYDDASAEGEVAARDDRPLLLFVCTGNICRSPMAAVIAIAAAREAGVSLRAASAGTAALVGHRAQDQARDAIAALGMDLGAHRAQQITRELVSDAALVVTATARQRDDLRYYFPSVARKIVSFDDATGLGELHDPYGEGDRAFADLAALLHRGMPAILRALQSAMS
jgi:protein-tyrosine-phosphatase